MAPKSRNTAAVSPILVLLVLWSSSNTLRTVDGLFLKVCSCSGVYTPPNVFENCSSYLVHPCPCPGEPQSSNETEFDMLVIPSRESFLVRWSQLPLDGVYYSLTSVEDSVAVDLGDEREQKKEGDHMLRSISLEINTLYTFTFCGWSNSTRCGCSTVNISTVNEFTPEGFQVLEASIMSDRVGVRWSAPFTGSEPTNYVLMYHAVGSQDIMNITYPGDQIPQNPGIDNLLPLTTYSVQVQAIFEEGGPGTTGELIVTTEPDEALAVQIYQNRLYSRSEYFVPEISGVKCTDDIGLILRNTEFFEGDFGILNVNNSLTSFSYNLQLRQFFYTTTDYSIFSISYIPSGSRPKVEGEQLILNRSQAVRSLQYDWSSERLYWIENETMVTTSQANGDDVQTVLDAGVTVRDLQLDPAHGYLYWLSNGQVSRCPLNLLVNCSDKKEQIPTSLGSVNDFALNTSSLETVLYRVNGTHLSVGDPDRSDSEMILLLNVSNAQTVLVSAVNLIILEDDKPFEVRNENLDLICARNTSETGEVDVSVLDSRTQLPFRPPNPPRNFTFIITATSVNVTWLSASEGAPSFSKYAPWRYQVEYSIDNVVQQTDDTPNTFFSRSQLTAGNAFTIRVIAEGQQGYSRTSPRFTVVTQSKADQMPVPLLLGTRSGLYRFDFQRQTSSPVASAPAPVVSVAQDVLRNVTYVLRNNEQIGVVNGNSYSVLFERSNVESLTVDWVANVLYWIEGGSTIMVGGTDLVRRDRRTLPLPGPFTKLASDPVHGLLFTSNGTSVTFHKVNGQPSQSSMQASTQCSSKLDRVLAMAADPDSRRLFWVSLRYNRLILNWASYNRETCSNSGQAVIPELELGSSVPRCVLSVSSGILAMKVEGVNKLWTAPVALFDFLQVDSSPGLQPFSLPMGMGGAEETYDIAFQQSNTSGVVPGVSAIPDAPTPNESDGNPALNGITIHWSAVEFTLSPLLYNVMYTLTRTDESVDSQSEMTAMTSVVLDDQTPYTNVEVTISAISYWGSSDSVTYSFRSTSAAPTVALQNVTASVYRARQGSEAVSVLVQWGLLTAEQLQGELQEYRVEVFEQGQSVANVSFPPNKRFGFLEPSGSFQFVDNVLYELQVYAVTEFPTVAGMETGLSPPSERIQFNISDFSPPLEVLVSTANEGVLLGNDNEQTELDLRGPLEYDALLRTYYGFVERNGSTFLSCFTIGDSGKIQELTAIPSGTQVMSLVLNWISKELYLLTVQGAQLAISSWSTQGGQSLQTVYSASTTFTAVTGRISPFTGTLYYALTASSDTTLFALDVKTEGDKMPLRIFPESSTGRRRRQTCMNPPSISLGQGFTTDGNGRAWVSSTDTGDIWSCTISGTALCGCEKEVTAASTSVLALAVDEARVYWTNTTGIFYTELDSDRTVVNIVSSTVATQILATSPGLQPLPDDSCLYPPLSQQPTVQIGARTNSTVNLTWSPAILPSNCTQVVTSLAPPNYLVEYTPRGSQEPISVRSNFDTSIMLTSLAAYTEYTVRVSGRNLFTPAAIADSLFGEPSPFRTLPGVPDPPESLSVVNYGTHMLKATWSPPREVFDDESQVRYCITARAHNSSFNVTFKANTTSRALMVTGLLPGTMYTVEVSALNSMYLSSPAMDTARTWALPPTLTATNRTSTSVLLTAVFPSGTQPILQVVLQQKINGAWQNVSEVEDVQNTLTFMRTDLEPFEQYSYRLYGVYESLQDSTPHSAAGEANSFRSESGVPSAPVLLPPEGNVLRWETLDDNGETIDQLIITFERTDGEPPEIVTFPILGTQTRLDTSRQGNISNNVQYNVTMVAVNAIGASQPSNPILFTKQPAIALEVIITVAVVGGVLVIVFLVLCCLFLWCCSVHYQNLKRREAIQHIAGNPNYDADLERLRVLKFSRDDYRSRVDYIYNGNDLERLEKFSRDKITLDKLLGEGAFGEVIAGTVLLPDDPEPKPVAIKVLHKDATEEQNRTFLSEAIIMSHFNHENVLKVMGVCINNNPNFIVLELMEAGNLLQFLRQAKRNEGPNLLTPIELTKASLDVAKGAKYLEALKFIHRDLAARNCLVSSYGEERVVKIADFGLARDLYSQEYYRKEGQGLLPIRWMPPESLQEGLFTTKSDVWAFGVTLWEIWTMGHQPYPARTNHEVFEFVIHGGRNEKQEGMSSFMYNVMTQCWQHNPEDRPTFFQLVEKLRSHHERMKCASVCIDDDLSDIEEEGELKRGDSNRSWLRGSLRDSMRRIRTSIHRQSSFRAIRRQSSFKSDTSTSHPTNGQVSCSSAVNVLESAFKESGPI